jgi:hypothetical protein
MEVTVPQALIPYEILHGMHMKSLVTLLPAGTNGRVIAPWKRRDTVLNALLWSRDKLQNATILWYSRVEAFHFSVNKHDAVFTLNYTWES